MEGHLQGSPFPGFGEEPACLCDEPFSRLEMVLQKRFIPWSLEALTVVVCGERIFADVIKDLGMGIVFGITQEAQHAVTSNLI